MTLEHWQEKLKKALRFQAIQDTFIKTIIQTRFYAGELAGLKRQEFPLATFVVQGPVGEDFDVYTGTVRVWAWSNVSEPESRNTFKTIEEYLHKRQINGDGLTTVYQSRGDAIASFEPTNHLYLWTGLFDFRCIHMVK